MGTTKTSKQQRARELGLLRARVAELEQIEAQHIQAQEALCKWNNIFEDAGWGIVMGSADGKLIEMMNPAFARMHGYTVEELTGRPMIDVFAPESRAELLTQIQIADERGHHDFEATHIRKDSSTFPVIVHITAIKDEAGCVQCRAMHVEDITVRRQEEAMLHTHRRLVILLSTTSDLSEGLGYLVEATCQIDGIDCASMFLVDRQTGAFDLVSNRGLSADFVKRSFHFNASTSLARLAMEGWSVFWSSQDVVPAEQKALRQDEGLRALAMIPVLYGGNVIAMLNPGSRTCDNFDASTRHTLAAIAAQIGEFVGRVSTEEALCESLFNLQNVFDTVGDFLFIVDQAGNILRANPAARKRLGYGEKELTGAPLLKIYPSDRQEETRAIIADMMVEKLFVCHIPVTTKDGNLIPVEMRIVQGQWDNRDVFFCLFKDVTDRRQTENALRESEERYRTLFETMVQGIICQDAEGQIISANPAAASILGLTIEQMQGRTSQDPSWKVVHEDGSDFPGYMHPALVALRTGTEVRNVVIGVFSPYDKECRWIKVDAVPQFRPGEDSPYQVYAAFDDITGRKRVEEALRRQNEYLNALQKTTFDLISWIDLSNLLEKIVKRAALLMGTSSGYLGLVDPVTNVIRPQVGLGALAEALKIQVKPGEGLTGTVWQTGQPLVIDDYDAWTGRVDSFGRGAIRSTIGVPLMSGSQVLGVLALAYEAKTNWAFGEESVGFLSQFARLAAIAIEHARLVEALRKSNADLQARSEELDAFGHTVAHDLKNPLSNIIGFTYLMEDKEGPPTADEMLQMIQTIKQLGLKMNSIIEELMLLAGLRRAAVRMEPLNMDNIMTEVLWRLTNLIGQSQAEVSHPANWPEVMGYAPWVEEVWINYINNAIKYGGTPPHIELGATHEGDNVRFWVRDNGPGLTPEEQARLFVPFERLDQAHVSGHGLGLSIVRRIVERMGGQVSVRSTGVAGEGSTFSFTLPGE